MNKNTFSNRVTWYNFILCIFVVWIHAQNVDLFTEVVMIDGKPLFNQIEQTIVSDIAVVGVAGLSMENRCSIRLSRRSFPILQWLVWQDFSCVPDTCFTEIIPGGKCWKNTRRGLWDC